MTDEVQQQPERFHIPRPSINIAHLLIKPHVVGDDLDVVMVLGLLFQHDVNQISETSRENQHRHVQPVEVLQETARALSEVRSGQVRSDHVTVMSYQWVRSMGYVSGHHRLCEDSLCPLCGD